MNAIYRIVFIAALSLMSSAPVIAAPPPAGTAVLAEHPQLRELLRQEMRALLAGLNRISTALPQGDWQTVAAQAGAMHDSFILQQQLSDKDRKTLKRSLPAAFIRLDQRFHRYAARLNRAAQNQDEELSVHFLSRTVQTCVECHQRFAAQRFPGFAAPEPTDGPSH